jgi:uncharacterized protein YdcH (DUF465 family)
MSMTPFELKRFEEIVRDNENYQQTIDELKAVIVQLKDEIAKLKNSR